MVENGIEEIEQTIDLDGMDTLYDGRVRVRLSKVVSVDELIEMLNEFKGDSNE